MSVRRPEPVLAAAVALCLPMVPGVLNGNITAASAGVRLLIALVICWFAGGLLTSIVDGYGREPRRNQALNMLAAARRSGTAGGGVAMPPEST